MSALPRELDRERNVGWSCDTQSRRAEKRRAYINKRKRSSIVLRYKFYNAVQYDSRKDGMYTAFMVNKVELSVNDAYKNYTENQCGLLLKFLRKDQFAHLQNNPRMMKIIEKLTPVAIM